MRPLVVIAMLFAGCASEPTHAPGASPERLLSALGTAQALQHESDELEARGDLVSAARTAQRVLDVPFPDGAAEREDVRLDAYGRVAELALAQNDLAVAADQAHAGLAEATRDSYFRARLHVVLGRVHQARAAHLRDTGDADGARTESEAAIDELEQSIAINRVVLGGGGR